MLIGCQSGPIRISFKILPRCIFIQFCHLVRVFRWYLENPFLLSIIDGLNLGSLTRNTTIGRLPNYGKLHKIQEFVIVNMKNKTGSSTIKQNVKSIFSESERTGKSTLNKQIIEFRTNMRKPLPNKERQKSI